MIDLSNFGYTLSKTEKCYFKYYNDLEIYIRTGEEYSYPADPDLDINDYKEVAFQVNYINKDISLEVFLHKMNNEELYSTINPNITKDINEIDISITINELELLLSCLDKYVSDSELGIINPLPCCKCKLNDKWNSLGKDNKWYCYQHCSY
jgi:hypothetical protein